MPALPPPDQLAMAALVIGILFALRYVLALRRIWGEAGRPKHLRLADWFAARVPDAYGPEMEPNRRYAARQLYTAAAVLLLAAGLFAWLLAANVIGPFVRAGMGTPTP